MPNRVPFTAYFKIVPERGSGKRFEIQRSRERFARLVWNDLNTNLENAIPGAGTGLGTTVGANFTVPGGSIHWGLAASDSSLSSNMGAVAVKPQFGESPDTLTVVGFYEGSNVIPYSEKQLISGGRVWNGPATGTPAYTISTEPNAANRSAARALKTALEGAIESVEVEMIKLEINGVKYGRGGLHFPL